MSEVVDAAPVTTNPSPEEFSPTPAMRRYAESCVAPDEKPGKSAPPRARTPAATLRRWRDIPGFSDWLEAEVRQLLTDRVSATWAAVNRLACQGNLQAARLFLDRFDPPQPEQASGPNTFFELAKLAELAEKEEMEKQLEQQTQEPVRGPDFSPGTSEQETADG